MHILQVAYDRGLLATRAILLERCGYLVTSVFGNDSAMGIGGDVLSTVDVVVIGFSTKPTVRAEVILWFKQNYPAIPVVALQVNAFEKFPKADCVTLSEDPLIWLSALARTVKPK